MGLSVMRNSPRLRRLQSDYEQVKRLVAQSSILKVQAARPYQHAPPDRYRLQFLGAGIESIVDDRWVVRTEHVVLVFLGPDYPRLQPDILWQTPIFHPNISTNGTVCLGPLRWHWTPSLALADLCRMLWDMIRYANFDVKSPLNPQAAAWAASQRPEVFPLDPRPLRDRVAVGHRAARLTDQSKGASYPADESICVDEPKVYAAANATEATGPLTID